MNKKKVTDLARSFSLSCKELVKKKQTLRFLPSPAVMLIAFTVVNHVAGIEPLKRGSWGG